MTARVARGDPEVAAPDGCAVDHRHVGDPVSSLAVLEGVAA